jgi:hypothetical protein
VVRTWREFFCDLGVVERDVEAIAPAFLYEGLFAEKAIEPPT